MRDLLEAPIARVQIDTVPPAAQRELQRFLDAGDIELIDGNYRPSARAIYGVYRRLQPPQARQ